MINGNILAAPSQPSPAFSPQEHLRGEMAFLTLTLKQVLLASVRAEGKIGPAEEFAGMYVSEEEIRRCLAEDDPGFDGTARDFSKNSLAERMRNARADLERRTAGLQRNGEDLRLPQLASRFDLSEIEVRLLSFCLAPDVDVRFHRLFAYLQNDVSKKRPCIQFLARLCEDFQDVVDARALLNPDAPLFRHRLLTLPARGAAQDVPIPLQQPIVSPTVVDFLFGQDRIDERLSGFARLVAPRRMPSFGAYTRHHQSILDRVSSPLRLESNCPLIYVAGPAGSQRTRLVEQVALEIGRRVLRVQARGLFASTETMTENLELLTRDAVLHGLLLHFENVDDLLGEEGRAAAQAAPLQAWLANLPRVPVIFSGTRAPAELGSVLGVPFLGFGIPHPSIEERSEIWSLLLPGAGEESRPLIDGLASKFRFTPGQIKAAIRAAATAANGSPALSMENLYRSCREASNQRLLAYAQKIVPKYGWNDIVLPPETARQLREISALVRHRRTVFGAWGFETKFSVGNGVNVLFAGPSGTGKTMSAEIIAGDLQLDLYKLDLSSVVSKYVGETERNLDKIFDEAETSNSILFFDEADALFGKRSEVKDAHDRYANIEINYLLQKLDDYVGIIILATNFKGNLDAAFTRRLNYIVDFPAPDAELRRQIWARVFPADVPLAADVDFDFLARKFEFSGGNIKNVALNSAFLAAASQEPVRMLHLVRATKREFQKLGRLCSKSEFGPYLNHVRN